MSRYIDADALQKDVRIRFMEDYHDGFGIVDIADIIDNQPTVDAVPVVHGEWVEKWRFKPNGNPYHKVGDMECSVCHSDMLGRYYSRYCPHCGAKMKGENDEQIHKG